MAHINLAGMKKLEKKKGGGMIKKKKNEEKNPHSCLVSRSVRASQDCIAF